MSNIIATVVTTGPNDFYHRLENEWHNVNDQMMAFFTGQGKEAEKLIRTMSGGNGSLTITLSCVIDGDPVAPVVVENISFGDLAKIQNWMQKTLVKDIFDKRDEWYKSKGKN